MDWLKNAPLTSRQSTGSLAVMSRAGASQKQLRAIVDISMSALSQALRSRGYQSGINVAGARDGCGRRTDRRERFRVGDRDWSASRAILEDGVTRGDSQRLGEAGRGG
jgi:hypothetical protein